MTGGVDGRRTTCGGRVDVRGLTWRPAGRRAPVLTDLDLRIEPGERVLLAGPSGAGKSTLLRALAGLLLTAEVGDLSGTVTVDGDHPREAPGRVGLLLQDPAAAVVASRVGRDVAFGLENTRVPRDRMPALVQDALAAARFPYDGARATQTLSGGEAQRLALAGALALRPRVLLLDEPTSMLDEENAAAVRDAVLSVVRRTGATLVVVEHRLDPWLEHVDRCVVLSADGAVRADGPPERVLDPGLAAEGIWIPGAGAPAPTLVGPALVAPRRPLPRGEPVTSAADVTVHHRQPFARRASGPPALTAVSATVAAGRGLALTGPSGAGKSTLLTVLAGLQEISAGRAEVAAAFAGRRGRDLARLSSRELARAMSWVPQTPEHGLVRTVVLDELLATATALGQPLAEARSRALALLETLGMSQLASARTHHLSGGEQRRLVVAASLVHGPSAVLLDEPTVGQDRRTWAAVMGVCASAVAAGAGVAVATHDEDAAGCLEDRLALREGRAVVRAE